MLLTRKQLQQYLHKIIKETKKDLSQAVLIKKMEGQDPFFGSAEYVRVSGTDASHLAGEIEKGASGGGTGFGQETEDIIAKSFSETSIQNLSNLNGIEGKILNFNWADLATDFNNNFSFQFDEKTGELTVTNTLYSVKATTTGQDVFKANPINVKSLYNQSGKLGMFEQIIAEYLKINTGKSRTDIKALKLKLGAIAMGIFPYKGIKFSDFENDDEKVNSFVNNTRLKVELLKPDNFNVFYIAKDSVVGYAPKNIKATGNEAKFKKRLSIIHVILREIKKSCDDLKKKILDKYNETYGESVDNYNNLAKDKDARDDIFKIIEQNQSLNAHPAALLLFGSKEGKPLSTDATPISIPKPNEKHKESLFRHGQENVLGIFQNSKGIIVGFATEEKDLARIEHPSEQKKETKSAIQTKIDEIWDILSKLPEEKISATTSHLIAIIQAILNNKNCTTIISKIPNQKIYPHDTSNKVQIFTKRRSFKSFSLRKGIVTNGHAINKITGSPLENCIAVGSFVKKYSATYMSFPMILETPLTERISKKSLEKIGIKWGEIQKILDREEGREEDGDEDKELSDIKGYNISLAQATYLIAERERNEFMEEIKKLQKNNPQVAKLFDHFKQSYDIEINSTCMSVIRQLLQPENIDVINSKSEEDLHKIAINTTKLIRQKILLNSEEDAVLREILENYINTVKSTLEAMNLSLQEKAGLNSKNIELIIECIGKILVSHLGAMYGFFRDIKNPDDTYKSVIALLIDSTKDHIKLFAKEILKLKEVPKLMTSTPAVSGTTAQRESKLYQKILLELLKYSEK